MPPRGGRGVRGGWRHGGGVTLQEMASQVMTSQEMMSREMKSRGPG